MARGALQPVSLPAVFEQYQKARTQFVQMVAELATRPQNIETLQNAGEPSACTRVAPHPWPRLARRASAGSCLPCSPVLSPNLHSWLPQALLSASPFTAYSQALRRPVSPGLASSPRLPAPLLAGLSGS